MTEQEYTVRVALFDRSIGGIQLEPASEVQRESVDNFIAGLLQAGLIEGIANEPALIMFDLVAPRDVVDTKAWAMENAEYWTTTLGYNAVAAPRVQPLEVRRRAEPQLPPIEVIRESSDEPEFPVSEVSTCPRCGQSWCKCGEKGDSH